MGNEAVSLSLSSGGRRSAHPGKAGVESVLEIRVPELSADIDGGLSLIVIRHQRKRKTSLALENQEVKLRLPKQ